MISRRLRECNRVKRENTALRRQNASLLRRIRELEEKNSDLMSHVRELEEKVRQEEIIICPDCFFVTKKESVKPLFGDNLNDIKHILAKAEDLSKVNEAIKNSGLPDADTYLNIVASFVTKLKKIDLHKLEKYDAEELSCEVTEKFFVAVKNNLLDNLICAFSALLRSDVDQSMKNKVMGILRELNTYFSDFGIYNRLVKVNSLATDEDYQEFDFVADTTEEATITDISILPYYMDYVDEDGEIDKFVYCGKGRIAKGR